MTILLIFFSYKNLLKAVISLVKSFPPLTCGANKGSLAYCEWDVFVLQVCLFLRGGSHP